MPQPFEHELRAMRHALLLAADTGVRTGPNPRVGCVLLARDGTVLAEGVHRGPGSPHAEVDALRRVQGSTSGTTAVVTLEPCNHTGRTGPCTRALLHAGVTRVVYAQTDPNPVAAGGGRALSAAGVDVVPGVLAERAEQLNAEWSFAVVAGRPHVTWKYAATLDGRVAAADGTSRWITGPQARREVHSLRAASDAVVVGTGTALADDPRLSVRDEADVPLAYDRQPRRVVVGHRDLPVSAKVHDGSAPTWQLRSSEPHEVLKLLWEQDVRRVLLEGGPTLAGAFLAADLVDRVVAYVAPALLGAGPAALTGAGVTTIAGAVRLRVTDVSRVGGDVRITAVPEARAETSRRK